MKIVFISGYFYPEQTADTHLNLDIVEEISKNGHDVKVIVPFPSRGVDAEKQRKYINKKNEKINKNLEIIRVGKIRKYHKSFFKKTLYLLKTTKMLYKAAKKYEADLYFIVSTPPFLGKIAIKLHKRGKKIIYKLQDVFPDSLIHSKGLNEKSILIRLLRNYESKVYKSLDRIITCSDDVKQTLINRGVDSNIIDSIFDWVDENTCIPIDKTDNILFDKFKLKRDDFIVYYAGNLGYLQDIKSMIMAADLLRDTNIKFVIIGNGVCEDDIRSLVLDLHLNEKVYMFPMQPVEMVSYVYSIGDVGLVLLNSNITKYAFPSKTWSILASGRMVICEAEKNSQISRMLTDEKIGNSFEPYDYTNLSETLRKYYFCREECISKGKNGRKFIEEKLNKKRAIESILKSINYFSKEN